MAFYPQAQGWPTSYQPITASNSVELVGYQYLVVAVAGNIELRGPNDASSATFAVVAGQTIPFGAGYVRTNTTASIIGIK